VSSELKHHKNNYAYYQKIVVSYNCVTMSHTIYYYNFFTDKRPFYQTVKSN